MTDNAHRAYIEERLVSMNPRAQELLFRTLFTPNRVALRFGIQKIISWANIGVRRE